MSDTRYTPRLTYPPGPVYAMTFLSDTDAAVRHFNPDGLDLLDIGSGTGANVRWFAQQGARAIGAECGPIQLKRARQLDHDAPERYVDAPGQDLPFEDASFDVVTFFHSLHHVPRASMVDALGEAARVLRPDGLIYIAEPLPEGPGHHAFLPIDDETIVRGWAQDALKIAAATLQVNDGEPYTSSWTYASFEDCVEDVVGVDPDRQERLRSVRDELKAAFHEHGELTAAGTYGFAQPCKVTLLRKP